ncbi:TetR/AcrR family transcriptional regulator [Mycolicibacterium aubagnense]|uniref:TetR family transcriptional regulator n=1 Tax=Mycolicibacterium aubagnense TaxID=319707 RepID=A0ABM7IIY2_9MYCO|nr:TetR/AcrR family transcriptional regulator [Mycolicibacterium aubagnense]TLH67576.1 TetR family transcriptional regulator [Mycolicibacterium aubagnense]WGI31884.1 TetR/AcrR family transcriptional regulator [Mycolicibacterium aubagnense]BBX86604.1 TetR family transcriptional regulator [Mycolicibacterium aubagnense]
MSIGERRERERAARRQLIVATARKLAEAEGWDAVTTRRLSAEIEYSQPVLYKHFAGMEQIADAIAVDGFTELAEAIQAAHSGTDATGEPLMRIALAYLEFARDNPAVYDAMFTRTTTLQFAAHSTPPQLTAAFAALRVSVGMATGEQDADTLTEVFWAALHGLVTLGRTERLRTGYDSNRLQALVDTFTHRGETTHQL